MLTKKCRLFQVFRCLLPSFSSILVVSVTNIYFGLLFLFSFGRLAELLPSFLYFHMLITWFPFFEYFLLCVCFKMKLFFVWEFSEIESEPTASFVPTILNPFSKKKKRPFSVHQTPTFARFRRGDCQAAFSMFIIFFLRMLLFLIITCIFVKLNKEQCLKNW